MINEIKMVEDLLNGKGIYKDCTYAHVYTLAKYYRQQGMAAKDVRRNIIDWMTKYKIRLDSDNIGINQIINRADKDDRPLRGHETVIRISDQDIMEIRYACDKPKIQLTALAFLCHAKAVGSDTISVSGLLLYNWLKVGRTQLYDVYLPELVTFGYIADKSAAKKNSKVYKLLVPFVNEGEHILKDNDIHALYQECFGAR